jgi:hypothetical protein
VHSLAASAFLTVDEILSVPGASRICIRGCHGGWSGAPAAIDVDDVDVVAVDEVAVVVVVVVVVVVGVVVVVVDDAAGVDDAAATSRMTGAGFEPGASQK